jgi:hypothetical protein
LDRGRRQADWAEFDAERRFVLISNRDGTLDIFGEKEGGRLTDEGDDAAPN